MTRRYKIVLIIILIILFFSLLANILMILSSYNKVEDKEEEIERKWLISIEDIPFNLDEAVQIEIEQTYLNFSPEIRVRNIDNGSQYIMTIKSDMSVDGLKRTEKEYYISKQEYEHLLLKKEGNTIYKTRYQIKQDNAIYEIDIFHNQLEGLAYLEIEFESEELAEKFQTPDWVIKDVTDDLNYKNGYLARYGVPDN